jgi:hypothetical protein
MNRHLPCLLALFLFSFPLAAHDFWIEPGSFESGVGTEVTLRLRVGQALTGDPLPRLGAQILEFYALAGERRVEISGQDGDEPAGRWRPEKPGLHTVVYISRGSYVELQAEKFSAYLIEEGLDTALAERRRRDEDEVPARERFARHAKALIAVGEAAGEDRALGLELELVAERNPYALTPGSTLPVRLLYHGRPLANAQVVARSQARREEPEIVRTDRQGRAVLHLDTAGAWLVKAVHMVRAEDDPLAEWHSLWASLTFALPGR